MIASILPIFGAAIVLWSTLRWYWFRICDGTDELLTALALVTALLLVALAILRRLADLSSQEPSQNWFLPALLTIIYAILLPLAPNLVLGILMISIIWSVAKSSGALLQEKMPAIFAMLLLALPLTSSFTFYCQWPLQVFIAQAAACILALYGLPLQVRGASIWFGGQPISIDAACSGLHFIWFSFYLGVLIAYLRGANWHRMIGTAVVSLGAALIANLARVLILCVLFIAGLTGLANNWIIHQAIGALAFLLISFLIVFSFGVKVKIPVSSVKSATPQIELSWLQPLFDKWRFSQLSYSIICLISALYAAAVTHGSCAYPKVRETWPAQLEGRQLRPLVLSQQEKLFQERFPGSIAKFSDGRGEVIFRKIYIPTRQLHPIADCLRGVGFRIEQESLIVDKSGDCWNRVAARLREKNLNVEERITDSTGGSWPTISRWYWAAILGQTKGPWLAITRVRTVASAI
jgi:exosortase/archaeosortase family protein